MAKNYERRLKMSKDEQTLPKTTRCQNITCR